MDYLGESREVSLEVPYLWEQKVYFSSVPSSEILSHTHTHPSFVTRSLAGYENCTVGGSALASSTIGRLSLCISGIPAPTEWITGLYSRVLRLHSDLRAQSLRGCRHLFAYCQNLGFVGRGSGISVSSQGR